jgi:hypothetical protein
LGQLFIDQRQTNGVLKRVKQLIELDAQYFERQCGSTPWTSIMPTIRELQVELKRDLRIQSLNSKPNLKVLINLFGD